MSAIKPNATSLDQPLLVSIKVVAKILGLSEQSVRRHDKQGKIPSSLIIGGSRKWAIGDLRRWIRVGCPPREDWVARAAVPTKLGTDTQAQPRSKTSV